MSAIIDTLRTARAEGRTPSAPYANLRGADLRGADLLGANLLGANLLGANLRGADLRGADLRGADLLGANLRGADLEGANLEDANLLGANLLGANLLGANLLGANLEGANLTYAHGVLGVTGLPSGDAALVPLVEEWRLTIGCWTGTTTELRELIALDDGWPEAVDDQITARRPILAALADMCDAWASANSHYLTAVRERWS